MKRFRDISGIALALAACAGPPAGGQIGPTADDPLARVHLYEVASEQVAQVPDSGFIEVSGSGVVSVAPDRAMVSFAMETRAPAANDAASANADAMDAVLAAVRGGSFSDLDLETFGYALQPEYSARTNVRTREIVAYRALNNVRATISQVDAVGRLIDVAIAAGANRVSNISFMASDTEEARSEALAKAVASARVQARVIAEALGHELGQPLEVRGGAQRPGPIRAQLALRTSSAPPAPTPVEAGDQSVTATVTIRFALGPELGAR